MHNSTWGNIECLILLLFLSTVAIHGLQEDSNSITEAVKSSAKLDEACNLDSSSWDFIDDCSDKIKEGGNMAANPAHHYVRTLAGIQMPKLIYGTAWKKERTADLVTQAIRAGFRGVDTACQPKHYFEPGVGAAMKVVETEDGIKREHLFIQTKFTSIDGQDPKNIPYDPRADLQTTVRQSLDVSLKNLNTDYIDSIVIHSPMRTHRDTMEVWRVFESFVDQGKVKQLGISNCYKLSEFQSIFNEARIKPAVLQNRLYAETDFDKGLRKFCKENGIYYQSFWTLTANPSILSSSRVREIAKKYGKTTPQIFFAYLIQTGVITPLTGTTNLQHMKEDLETLDMNLTEDEMSLFDSFIN